MFPTEILVNIIQFVPDKDLINFFSTCKTFNRINNVLTPDFWSDRGYKFLYLNVDKVELNLIGKPLGPTGFKCQYQYISSHLRRFTYCSLNGEVSLNLYMEVRYILQRIKNTDSPNLPYFIRNNNWFMTAWVKFIVRELNCDKSPHIISNLLCIPLSFEHVNCDSILFNIIEAISHRRAVREHERSSIVEFFNCIIVSDDINKIDVWMTLMKHNFERLYAGRSTGVLFLTDMIYIEFEKEAISDRVWDHLYGWTYNKYSPSEAFLERLRSLSIDNFNSLMKFDKGIEIDREVIYLSYMFTDSEYRKLHWNTFNEI